MAKSEWTKRPDLEAVLPFETNCYTYKDLRVMVGIENGFWHLSISCENRDPTYHEIKKARYDLMPNSIHVAQIFPPKDEFVNVHEHCFHLFQLAPNEIARIAP